MRFKLPLETAENVHSLVVFPDKVPTTDGREQEQDGYQIKHRQHTGLK